MNIKIKDVKVYDNGGKTFDRYTVIIGDDFYGMSRCQTPQGFNQYCGSTIDGYTEGDHLGKKLNYIPKWIRPAIKNRIADYE